MKNALTPQDQHMLRSRGILQDNEVAYQEGDLYVAENVLSGHKRIINAGSILAETTNKQILHG